MTRDPFERMRAANPAPPDHLPSAPMETATRIMAPRAGLPGWVVAVAAASLVVIVGGGTMLLTRGGDGAVVASESTSTTATTTLESTIATTEPTPPDATTTTTLVDDLDFPTAVYFLMEASGPGGGGPYLVPVSRMVDEPDPVTGTILFLLAGPTLDEATSIPAISTAIPEGTTLKGVTVDGGIATIDLSAEFATGSGSFAEIARLDQIKYTLTRFPEIDSVRLAIDGEPVELFGSHGIVLDEPIGRSDIDLTLPPILIESPVHGDFGTSNPLVAFGTANVFEATVSLALTDGDGLILWEGFTTATCGTGCRGDWEVTIPYQVSEPQMGALIAWEESARDGSQTNVREHPVWLIPADDGTASAGDIAPRGECSGTLVVDPLGEEPNLPAVVTQTRAGIFTAATLCDWELLGTLIAPEGFTYSFGGGDDPIGHWQELEAAGAEPMRYLAELLRRPVWIEDFGEVVYHTWPSAFGPAWPDVPEADREALRPLYGDDDFAGFADFGGYFGYRVGITGDGAWVYFVAGD